MEDEGSMEQGMQVFGKVPAIKEDRPRSKCKELRFTNDENLLGSGIFPPLNL